MANPITIPGVSPQSWTSLLAALSAAGTDVATLSEQGITTIDQLKAWLAENNYELIEISDVVGYTLARITPVDAANSNAVSTQVVTDIVATGGAGTAVSTVTTAGNRTLGLVTKLAAVSACISLLVSTIGAGLVNPEVKTDLVTAADPYTFDGENVLVLIDENGKTHYQKELVEAIRAKAAELGVFSTGDLVINSYTPPSSAWDLSGFNTYSFPLYISNLTEYTQGTFVRTASGSGNIYSVYFVDSRGGTNPYIRPVFVSDQPFTVTQRSTTTGGTSTYNAISVSIDGVNYYYYGGSSTSTNPVEGLPINPTDKSSVLGSDVIKIVFGGTIEGGGGVDGITPNSNTADDLQNLGIPISDILPQLEQYKLELANPTEEDLEHKSDWYPVSTVTEDVFEDGATEDETSTATEGNVAPEVEPDILDQIKELIESLTQPYPDVPTDTPTGPVIEVGDSGDTPPENPPLEPPSDATGSNGLWSIYNPSLQQVHDFGAWLWSDTLADQFKRIFNSPIDGVIGFHMLYCTPTTGTSKYIQCGFLTSPVSAPVVSNPYVEIDCGSVTVDEYYGNSLDYDNTRISLYLPFVGIVPLDTNIVMGSEMEVTYRVDVLTGTCLAQVKVIKQNSNAVMYSFAGNCAVQVPLTATTYTGVVGALLNGISAGASIMTGNLVQAAGSAVGALANGFSGLSGTKQSGTFGANAGALGIRIPYVIITHPVTAMPYNFEPLQGLPSNSAVRLSALSGFTRVKYVHLENIGSATEEEINMIKELLMEGVII